MEPREMVAVSRTEFEKHFDKIGAYKDQRHVTLEDVGAFPGRLIIGVLQIIQDNRLSVLRKLAFLVLAPIGVPLLLMYEAVIYLKGGRTRYRGDRVRTEMWRMAAYYSRNQITRIENPRGSRHGLKGDEDWIFVNDASFVKKMTDTVYGKESDARAALEALIRLCGNKMLVCQYYGYIYRVDGGFRFEQWDYCEQALGRLDKQISSNKARHALNPQDSCARVIKSLEKWRREYQA